MGRSPLNASVATVVGVHVGEIAALGRTGVASGFIKHAVAGRVAVSTAGLAGDAQADRRVHGGPDKAVYAYPAAAYARWRSMMPGFAERLIPGGMGENLTVDGWSDAEVAIGDRVRVGSALLQVSEPRTPCFKLGLAFGDSRMVKTFAVVGISGWYYRVLEEGTIGCGDALTCLERPNPEWTVARFFAMITGGSIDRDALVDITGLEGVAERWRTKAARLLASRGNQ